jgi:4-alpha-glucanotransferase
MKAFGKRRAGVLFHITSLPPSRDNARYWQGDMGDEARHFISFFLKPSKLSVWQVLPIHPLRNYSDLSPYQPQSVNAGNPLLISLEWFCDPERSWLVNLHIPKDFENIQQAIEFRLAKLQEAFQGFKQNKAYEQFIKQNEHWLKDYALFCCLKNFHDNKPWWEWNDEHRNRDERVLEQFEQQHQDSIGYYYFEQFVFYTQWSELKEFANKNDVYLCGDMPFFVSYDSVDTWVNNDYFHIDDGNAEYALRPGVPPNRDSISPDGQCWKYPVYDWNQMEKDGFKWWIQRFKTVKELFDIVRLTHFRGYVACWGIKYPYQDRSQGKWLLSEATGYLLFKMLKENELLLPILAEDLGSSGDPEIDKQAKELRSKFSFSRFRVLQFAFSHSFTDKEVQLENPHLPHHYLPNSVVYTSTHDTDTLQGWFLGLSEDEKEDAGKYLWRHPTKPATEELFWHCTDAIYRSGAGLCMLAVQDIMFLGSESRMNTPNTENEANWRWQLNKLADIENLPKVPDADGNLVSVNDKLAKLAACYERSHM